MKEYLILTATFTVPFALLGLLNCTPAIFRAVRQVRIVRHVRQSSRFTPTKE